MKQMDDNIIVRIATIQAIVMSLLFNTATWLQLQGQPFVFPVRFIYLCFACFFIKGSLEIFHSIDYNLLQVCSGILLEPNVPEQGFSIFKFIYFSGILIIIGLMIAIKNTRHNENDINPKNLDSFWLNSILASLAIYLFICIYYLKG